MDWKKFNTKNLILSIAILIIGLILKFPYVLEIYPPQYKLALVGMIFTEAQYSIINIISYIIIFLGLIYMIILIINKFKQ